MAIYEVSTWTELIAKLSDTTAEEKTIKLIADIDCNDEIPMGVETTIDVYGSGSYPTIIDGAYHTIRNLRTHITSPVDIFAPRSINSGNKNLNIDFNNIDFVNLILDKAYMFGQPNSGVISNNKLTFNKCRFVGRRNRYLLKARNWGSANGNATTFNSCFFNIPCTPTATENTYVPLSDDWYSGSTHFLFANFCWFKEKYNGWEIADNVDTPTSMRYMQLNGCYIDGELVGSNELKVTGLYTYQSPIQNVVDADIKLKNGSDGANIYAPSGVWRNDVKSFDGATSYTTTNINISAIPESPENMKNPAQLYADGFDIVVPSGQGV